MVIVLSVIFTSGFGYAIIFVLAVVEKHPALSVPVTVKTVLLSGVAKGFGMFGSLRLFAGCHL